MDRRELILQLITNSQHPITVERLNHLTFLVQRKSTIDEFDFEHSKTGPTIPDIEQTLTSLYKNKLIQIDDSKISATQKGRAKISTVPDVISYVTNLWTDVPRNRVLEHLYHHYPEQFV